MKSLYIHRGKSQRPFVCANGDTYDSTGELFNEQGHSLWKSDVVNTDSTAGYKGGKLAEGVYFGIVGYRAPKPGQDRGKRVIKLFRQIDTLPKDYGDLTIAMMTLPSLVPNPNHDNQHIIKYVQVHDGGLTNDWSHGCLTILDRGGYTDFTVLMSRLSDNENIEIILA